MAEQHGWTDDPAAGVAYKAVGGVLAWQGQPDEAEPWVQRAEPYLASLGDHDRGEMRIAPRRCGSPSTTHMRRPPLAPVLDGSARMAGHIWLVQASLLEAIARRQPGPGRAARARDRYAEQHQGRGGHPADRRCGAGDPPPARRPPDRRLLAGGMAGRMATDKWLGRSAQPTRPPQPRRQ